MALVYFDSSALVKLVVQEAGSELAAELWDGCDAALHPATCPGLSGFSAGLTEILDGKALTFAGRDYLYLTAGTGAAGFQVYRLAQ